MYIITVGGSVCCGPQLESEEGFWLVMVLRQMLLPICDFKFLGFELERLKKRWYD